MDVIGDISKTFTMPSAAALGVALLLLAAIIFTRRRKPSREAVPIEPLKEFDWKTTQPNSYRPFKPIYHITLGLRSNTPSDLITIDMDYLDRVNLRRRLISQHGESVHGCLPAGVDAVRELYQFLLRDYLPVRFPTMFKLSGQGQRFENRVTDTRHGTNAPQDTAAALRVLGETVEEDMFLVREEPEGHRAVAFVCCFPMGFDPSSKLGKPLKEIHAPVPSYEKIGPSMERFFRRLEVGKNVKRINWTIQTHPELFNGKGSHASPPDDEIDMTKVYMRVEVQTLSRLPLTRTILFSFKTYLYPVGEIKEEGLGPQLADAIEGLKAGNAPGMWTYKGTVGWGGRVCEYLRS